MPDHQPAAPGQYLSFHLGGEEYGVAILRVREIVRYGHLTPVPRTPEWIRGLANLRGNVLPVVDLGLKFGRSPTAIADRTCILILEVDHQGEPTGIGVMADAVGRVLELDQVEPPPPFGTRVRVDFLLGMGKVDQDLILILDVDRVLSPEELLVATRLAGEEESD